MCRAVRDKYWLYYSTSQCLSRTAIVILFQNNEKAHFYSCNCTFYVDLKNSLRQYEQIQRATVSGTEKKINQLPTFMIFIKLEY